MVELLRMNMLKNRDIMEWLEEKLGKKKKKKE